MHTTVTRSGQAALLVGLGAALLLPTVTDAQVATALLREDDELLPGETISSVGNTAVNHVGGYACGVNTSGTGTLSHIWGAPFGGTGMVLRTESTIGVYEQTSFESFYGMGDMGELAYGTTSNNTMTGDTGIDGVWLDDTSILQELEPVPSLPGMFSTFNSRPTSSGNGVIVWVGGFTDTQGGSTQNRAMFSGAGAMPLIMGGDALPGVAEPVDDGTMDFDFRVSRYTTYWINNIQVDGSTSNNNVMVISGMPIIAGGVMMREDNPIPASLGGLPDERWDNFDYLGINESMDYFVTGDTTADTSMDEYVSMNGQIILREGAVLDVDGDPATISGSIEGGYMNEDTDWAVIWDVDDVNGDNLEALIFNGEVLLLEGDPVDWNGDGMIDAGDNNGVLANFTGISTLTVGAPVGGFINIYFTADIDFNGTSSSSDDLEGFFCLAVESGALQASLDIKPGSCPNSFNRGSNGVLPVALLGTDDFDVSLVDIGSLMLGRADGAGGLVAPNEGPPGPHTTYEDVATPFMGEDCDCHGMGGDGFVDLMMHFRTQDVVDALELGDLPGGALVQLVLTGYLVDGTVFEAYDCIRLVPPGAGPMSLAVGSTVAGAWVDVLPLDLTLDGGGFARFLRTYPEGTQVTLIAPTIQQGRRFAGWAVQGTPGLITGQVLTIDLSAASTGVSAVYGKTAPLPAAGRSVTSIDTGP